MTREALHMNIDKMLDDMGFKNNVTLKWGCLTFQVNFEAGREILRVKERETQKDLTSP